MCNSPAKGLAILKYNLEENSDKRACIRVSSKQPLNPASGKAPGLFRKFLGIVDGNLLFSYKANGASLKSIYGLAINPSLEKIQMNSVIEAF